MPLRNLVLELHQACQMDVLDHVVATVVQFVNAVLKEPNVGVNVVVAVVDHQIEAAVHIGMTPQAIDRVNVRLIALKGLDLIRVEQDPLINVRPEDLTIREELGPGPQRGTGFTVGSHVGVDLGVRGTDP